MIRGNVLTNLNVAPINVWETLVDGSITEFDDVKNEITTVATYAFCSCSNLTRVNLPVTTVLESRAFQGCSKLTSVSVPSLQEIGRFAFSMCYLLSSIELPSVTSIYGNAFQNCSALTTIYLTGSSLCTLASTTAFNDTGLTSIYVPASLYSDYIIAPVWSLYSNKFVSIQQGGE